MKCVQSISLPHLKSTLFLEQGLVDFIQTLFSLLPELPVTLQGGLEGLLAVLTDL